MYAALEHPMQETRARAGLRRAVSIRAGIVEPFFLRPQMQCIPRRTLFRDRLARLGTRMPLCSNAVCEMGRVASTYRHRYRFVVADCRCDCFQRCWRAFSKIRCGSDRLDRNCPLLDLSFRIGTQLRSKEGPQRNPAASPIMGFGSCAPGFGGRPVEYVIPLVGPAISECNCITEERERSFTDTRTRVVHQAAPDRIVSRARI